MVGLATTVLLSGGVAEVVCAGTVEAQPGFSRGQEWCPGQPWEWATPPPANWDMSVCHNVLAVGQPDGSLTIDEETIPPPVPIFGLPWSGGGG